MARHSTFDIPCSGEKNSLFSAGVHPCGETQKLGTGCDGSRRGLRRSGLRPRLLVWLGGARRSPTRPPKRRSGRAAWGGDRTPLRMEVGLESGGRLLALLPSEPLVLLELLH